jgi:GMP synthase PP-ATPase subunit
MNKRNRTRLERRPLWSTYRHVYETILSILFRHDPIGICMKANPKRETEYITEVDLLLPNLKRATSVETTRRIIYEEFVRCFGTTAKTETHYDAIAQEIWAFVREPQIAEQLRAIDDIANMT